MPINDGNYTRTLYDTITNNIHTTNNDVYTTTNTTRWEPYPEDLYVGLDPRPDTVREIPTVVSSIGNGWNYPYSMENLIREEVAKYMRKLFAILRDYKYISADIKEEEFIALLNEASNE